MLNESFPLSNCIWMRKLIGHVLRDLDIIGIFYEAIEVSLAPGSEFEVH